MTNDAVAIARAAYAAYVAKDRAAIEALIADEFHFTSPLDKGLRSRSVRRGFQCLSFDNVHTTIFTPDGRGGISSFERTQGCSGADRDARGGAGRASSRARGRAVP